MADIKIQFYPFKKQAEWLLLPNNIKLYSGAYGSGKSATLCVEAFKQSNLYAKNRGLICRKQMTDLRNTTMKEFFKLFPLNLGEKEGRKIFTQWHKTSSTLTLNNGSEIIFGGLDSATKWASAEFGWVLMDEAIEFTEDDFNMLISRLRLPNVDKHILGLACNPSSKTHWIYERFFKQRDTTGYGVVETISTDNVHLPQAALDRYEQWQETDPDYYKRYILGQWGQFEGLVYKTFDTLYNVRDVPFNTGWRLYRSIDWGFNNPSVCLFIGVDFDDNIFVFDEIYESGLTINDFAENIKQASKAYQFTDTFADPSEPGNVKTLELCGIYVNKKTDNEIKPGINSVRQAMPKLFVSSRCKNLIREFQSYRYKDNKSDRNPDELPLKKDDHSMDAIRYFVYNWSGSIKDAKDSIQVVGHRDRPIARI